MKVIKILFTLAAFSIMSPVNCMHLYHTREMTKTAAQRAADATQELQSMENVPVSFNRSTDAKKIEELVAKGAHPDTPIQNGDYPLIFAARERWPHTVTFLLQHNANPNIQNSSGQTALIAVISTSRYENPKILHQIVENLLNKSANPNIQDRAGDTALIVATHENKPGIVEFLLNNGADPNIQNHLGNTALIKAVRNHNPEIVRILLENGADYRIANNIVETPLMIARNNNYQEIIKIINEFERKKLE